MDASHGCCFCSHVWGASSLLRVDWCDGNQYLREGREHNGLMLLISVCVGKMAEFFHSLALSLPVRRMFPTSQKTRRLCKNISTSLFCYFGSYFWSYLEVKNYLDTDVWTLHTRGLGILWWILGFYKLRSADWFYYKTRQLHHVMSWCSHRPRPALCDHPERWKWLRAHSERRQSSVCAAGQRK